MSFPESVTCTLFVAMRVSDDKQRIRICAKPALCSKNESFTSLKTVDISLPHLCRRRRLQLVCKYTYPLNYMYKVENVTL